MSEKLMSFMKSTYIDSRHKDVVDKIKKLIKSEIGSNMNKEKKGKYHFNKHIWDVLSSSLSDYVNREASGMDINDEDFGNDIGNIIRNVLVNQDNNIQTEVNKIREAKGKYEQFVKIHRKLEMKKYELQIYRHRRVSQHLDGDDAKENELVQSIKDRLGEVNDLINKDIANREKYQQIMAEDEQDHKDSDNIDAENEKEEDSENNKLEMNVVDTEKKIEDIEEQIHKEASQIISNEEQHAHDEDSVREKNEEEEMKAVKEFQEKADLNDKDQNVAQDVERNEELEKLEEEINNYENGNDDEINNGNDDSEAARHLEDEKMQEAVKADKDQDEIDNQQKQDDSENSLENLNQKYAEEYKSSGFSMDEKKEPSLKEMMGFEDDEPEDKPKDDLLSDISLAYSSSKSINEPVSQAYEKISTPTRVNFNTDSSKFYRNMPSESNEGQKFRAKKYSMKE